MNTRVPANKAFPDLSRLLRPASIAVIGASDRPGNFGGATVGHLIKFGYPGPIWPVNPGAERVRELKCYANPAALPAPADLAVLNVPAAGLLQAISDCAAAGIRNGLAFSGGFADAGAEGLALQERLVGLCARTGFNLCGPNGIGLLSSGAAMAATFASTLQEIDRLRQSPISLISQSGAILSNVLALLNEAGFGFQHLISSGNEAFLTFADYLHSLACDDGTRVILGYIEGIADGPRTLAALAEARRRSKPVILLKGGATAASARAVLAHTGVLAGENRVFDAVCNEMAVIRVRSVEELVDTALLAISNPIATLPAGTGMGIVTFGGGMGVLAADQCAEHGLSSPRLAETTVTRLREALIPAATATNPVDLTPATAMNQEWLARLPQAFDALAADPNIDMLLFIVGALASRAREISEVIVKVHQQSKVPLCVAWPMPPNGVPERLAGHGIYSFAAQSRGILAAARLARYHDDLSRPPRSVASMPQRFDWPKLEAARGSPVVVPEHRCHELLTAAGLATAPGRLAMNEHEAVDAARAVGLPVALKCVSPQVTHRAAAGLLAVDLRDEQAVAEAYLRLSSRAAAQGIAPDGIYVQHMVAGRLELLVSAFRDPVFGIMVTCGAGGNFTELLDDVIIARAPVDAAMARELLGRLRIARNLHAPEGDKILLQAAQFVAQLSALAATAPWPRFVLEVNPIKCGPDGAIAVDGLLIVEQS